MNCRICGNSSENFFREKILNKYEIQYFHCHLCNFLFTEDSYWLGEAYTSAINTIDTGLMERNLYFNRVVSVLLYFFFGKGKKFLDYAGGY